MSSAAAVFAIRDWRYHIVAKFLSSVATEIVWVAVGWRVYALTGDPLYLGYVGLSLWLPAFLLMLPGGVVADRFDRRWILVAAHVVEAVSIGALAFVLTRDAPFLPFVFALLAAVATVQAFIKPAIQSIVPLLVPSDLFQRALALGAISWQGSIVLGPAIGGILYAVGPAWPFGAAIALICIAIVGNALILTSLKVHSAGAKGFSGISEGLRFVWSKQEVLGAISLDLFAVLLGGATALLPMFAQDVLMVGPEGLGILRSAPAVGAALTALILSHRPLGSRVGHRLLFATAVFGGATIVFGLSTNFWLSLGALVVLGGADMVGVVIRQTLVQIQTPDALRGRVSAVNLLFIGASNELGDFESGVMAAWLGGVAAVTLGGVGAVMIAVTWALLFPRLRRIEQLERMPSSPQLGSSP